MKVIVSACRCMIVIACCVLGSAAYGQSNPFGGRFDWVNPPLSAERFNRVRSVGGNGYEIYGESYVIRSTDGGVTWRREGLDSLALALSARASFVGSDKGWALLDPYSAASNQSVMATTDGGRSWREIIRLADQYVPRGISFGDASTGWIVGDRGLIMKSTDGGASWIEQPKLTTASLYTVNAVTASRAVIAIEPSGFLGELSGLFRTVDGGGSWDTLGFVEKSPSLATRPNVSAVAFPDSTTGYLFTIIGQVYKSSDAGATWRRMPTGLIDKLDTTHTVEPLMGSPLFTDPLHGWTIGVDDELFFTKDGAESWTVLDTGRMPVQMNDPVSGGKFYFRRQRLQQLIMTESGVLLAIGEKGDLRRSADSGRTWTMLNQGFTSTFLTSTAFVTRAWGWVAGGGGTIYRTTDAGAGWTEQESNTEEPIRDLAAVDEQTAWAATLAGVLRTVDGGATWEYHEVPGIPLDTVDLGEGIKNMYGITSLRFIDRLRGWCAGNRGAVFATTDGGIRWTRLATPPNYERLLKDVWFSDPLNGWVVGAIDGGVFATTDGGASWSRQTTGDIPGQGNAALYPYNAATFVDAKRGTIVGDRGRAFSTTDGGQTWTTGATGAARDMQFGGFTRVARPSDSIVWASGSGEQGTGGIVARSTDGGVTWNEPRYLIPQSVGGTLLGLSFPDKSHGWFVGSNGYVISYTADSTPSDVARDRAAARELVVAPNPASDRFDIHFTTSSRTHVRLALFNVRGEEVLLAADRPFEPGEHAIRIDGADRLPPGVYYVHLLDEEGARVRSVVVQR